MKLTTYTVAVMLFAALFMGCNKNAQANTPKEFTPADVPDYLDVGFSSMGFSWLKGYDMATLPEKLVIPNGIEYIDKKAFAGCKILESVVIPESLTDIRDSAFYDCENLKSVTFPATLRDIGANAFEYCTVLVGDIVIPGGVLTIGRQAFKDCKSIKSVTIEEGVTKIGLEAFVHCSSLENVVIPDSVTDIEQGAFAWCSSLKSVTIPATVTKIGDHAFYDSVKEVYFKGRKAHWQSLDKGKYHETFNENTIVHCSDGDLTKWYK